MYKHLSRKSKGHEEFIIRSRKGYLWVWVWGLAELEVAGSSASSERRLSKKWVINQILWYLFYYLQTWIIISSSKINFILKNFKEKKTIKTLRFHFDNLGHQSTHWTNQDIVPNCSNKIKTNEPNTLETISFKYFIDAILQCGNFPYYI